ncbi:MAG: HEPN domain-containing protein [Acidobacteriota bacterium]|nr:HEPN domain-containing protein [Blastocatellia bacterium]MDW8241466.1 HEPN domain-containing protein [Acidobacteriota bacterium]
MEWKGYWLKAKENLDMAVLAHQMKKHNVCASRAYYAVFLASIALLIKLTDYRAKDNEWEHGQVQAELNRRLIMRRKVLPAELGRTPMDLITLRHLADYKPHSVAAKEAKRACDRAAKFLTSVERALGETG